MVFDIRRGYAGNAPGQQLKTLLEKLTSGDLKAIVGPIVLAMLTPSPSTNREELIASAEHAFRYKAKELLADPSMLRTLLRNLDAGKLDELKHRFSTAGISLPSEEIDVATLAMGPAWSVLAGFLGFEAEETLLAPATLSRTACQPAFPLFAHQRSIVHRAYRKISAPRGRTIIHMPTGAGKTRTAAHLVCRVLNESEPGLIVWLANSRELLDQAAETLITAWTTLGNREVTFLRFWGSYNPVLQETGDGVVIASMAKMHFWRQRNSAEFLRFASRVQLVVVDEAHQAIAPTYRNVIDALCGMGAAGSVVGLTATPGRTWNDSKADEELADFFGASKVVLEIPDYENPVQYLIEAGYLAKPIFHQLEYTPSVAPPALSRKEQTGPEEYSDAVLESLAEDTARNLAVLQAVADLITREHHRIILFALSVEHAQHLTSALAARGIDAEMVSGETPATERSAILKRFKQGTATPRVVCNFGVLTTGFDAPRISAAIIARPTKSLVLYSQMVGRATRGVKAGGNSTCEIVTVHDPTVPGFGDIAEAFFNWEDTWHDD